MQVIAGEILAFTNFLIRNIFSSDKIVVLHGGKIVEEGTFDELNKIQDGFFKQLVLRQTISDKGSS